MVQSKRFIPISQYCKISGLSYATVNHMLNSGQLSYVTTESGQRRVDTNDSVNADSTAIARRLDETERLLKSLCTHLGVSVAGR